MAYIATGSTTVGEVIDGATEFILNGLYREKQEGKGVRKGDIVANRAARRAIEIFAEHLGEMYCGDGNTRFVDVKVPS